MAKRLLLVIIAMLTMGLPFANATAQLSLVSGVNSVTIVDVGNVGTITFSGPLGNFVVNVTTGITKPILGSATAPQMDLNSVNVTSQLLGGTIQIMFTDTDFIGPVAGFFQAMIGGTTQGTVVFNTYLDPGNVPFGTAIALTPTATFTPGAFSGTFNSSSILPVLTTYSLTEVVTITQGAQSATSFDAHLSTVPEPSALLLLGTGLSALGIWRLRKTR